MKYHTFRLRSSWIVVQLGRVEVLATFFHREDADLFVKFMNSRGES